MLGSDRFVIERRLGEGSMGAVYLAFDRELQVRVALKTLRRVDPSGIYRFKREFRALSDLSHPNLVQLHELFSAGDQWFFTMEYVVGKDFLSHVLGGTLRAWAPSPSTTGSSPKVDEHGELLFDTGEQRVDGLEILFPTPLQDEERLRQVLIQITEGLMAVHAAGKLHRDLKSENVMVTPEGRAVLLDFGIALERGLPDAQQTFEPTVLGTPAYMSPEQAAGHVLKASSDWYALGVMIYEALTGSLPFDGSYMEVIQKKQRTDPQPPSGIVSGVPEDLEALCMSLLNRDPQKRPRGDMVLRALRRRKHVSSPPARPRSTLEIDLRPFVGRVPQVQAVREVLSATDQGHAAIVLVEGPSGIGKTTLVEHCLGNFREERKAVILNGRCYERESVPFKAIDSLVDNLSRYLRRLPAVQAAEVMPRDVMALAHLFPVLKRVPVVEHARRRAALPGDGLALRKRAFGALRELLSRIADRNPLVLFVDDLQWGDVDSARLLTDMVTGEGAPALLLVCAYRSGESHASPCLRALAEGIRPGNNYDVRTIVLDPLSEAESVDLAKRLLNPAARDEARRIGEGAAGSPFLVTELVDFVNGREVGSGAINLKEAMSARMQSLSHDARTLLQLVAVAGRPVSEEVLSLAATFDINLQSALTELRARKLVRGVGSREARAIECYHDHIRQTVLGDLQPEQLQMWNRRLATTLEASGSEDLEALTEHLLGAGEFNRAGLYAVRAAAQAAQVLAFDKAARLYELAAQHVNDAGWERQEVYARWAETLVNAGRSAEAARVYFEAAEGATEREARDLRRKAGVQLLTSGHYGQSLEVLAESLRSVNVELPESEERARESVVALRELIASRGLDFTLRREHEVPSEVLSRIDLVWSITLGLMLNDLTRGVALACRVLLDSLEAGEPHRVIRALCLYHSWVDLPLSQLAKEPTAGALELAQRESKLVSSPEIQAWLTMSHGVAASMEGNVEQAVEELEQAADIFRNRCQGAANEVRMCRQIAAGVQVVFSSVERLELIARWTREAEERQDLVEATRLRGVSIYAALRDDNASRAAELAKLVGTRFQGRSFSGISDWTVVGAVHLYNFDSRACSQHAERFEAVLQGPLAIAAFWRCAARWMRVRLLLCASATSSDAGAVWATIDDDITRIRRIGLAPFQPAMDIAEAQLCRLRGMPQRANGLAAGVADNGSPVLQPAAQMLLGEWMGGEGGKQVIAEAAEILTGRGVANPALWSRLYAPRARPGELQGE